MSLHFGASFFRDWNPRFSLTVMEELQICLMLEVKTETVAEGGLMSRVVGRK